MSQLIVLLISLIILSTRAHANFVVSYFVGGGDNDTYNAEIINLALEKTRSTHGDFQLSPITTLMTPKRRMTVLEQNQFPNLVVMLGFSEPAWSQENLSYINFPIDLGMLGWRICFVSPQAKEKIKRVKSLDELRHYSIAQGTHWRDNDILRANGFQVIDSPNFSALFKMVARGRADLFCRGINELKNEYQEYKHLGNLYYDESFALNYTMPIFFHLHKNNTLAKQRIETGIKIAYEDGSLMQLWLNKYKASIRFANLKQRKIYHLKNSPVNTPPKDYEKYLLDPNTLE